MNKFTIINNFLSSYSRFSITNFLLIKIIIFSILLRNFSIIDLILLGFFNIIDTVLLRLFNMIDVIFLESIKIVIDTFLINGDRIVIFLINPQGIIIL